MLIEGFLGVFFERLFLKKGLSAAENVPNFLSRKLDTFTSRQEKQFNRNCHTCVSKYLSAELKDKLMVISENDKAEYVPFLMLQAESQPSLAFDANRNRPRAETRGPITALLEQCSRRIYNGDTIRVHSHENNVLKIATGSYFETLETTDRFYYSLCLKKPWRRDVENDLIHEWSQAVSRGARGDFSQLSASMGVSVCIARQADANSWNIYYKHRSKSTATGAFQYHVVPSFMASPFVGMVSSDFDDDYIRLQIAKEYLEELESAVDLESDEISKEKLRSYMENVKSSIATEIVSHDTNLHFLGFGFDVFRLRPEMMFLLTTTSEPNFDIRQSWETRRIESVKVDRETKSTDLRRRIGNHWKDLCPPGKAALLLATEKLQHLRPTPQQPP